jgi:hypothetical protein
MANFDETNQNLTPQLKAVTAASTSLKANSKFKRLLEVKSKNSIRLGNDFLLLRLSLLLVII